MAHPVPSNGFPASASVTIPPLGAVWLLHQAEPTEESDEPEKVAAGHSSGRQAGFAPADQAARAGHRGPGRGRAAPRRKRRRRSRPPRRRRPRRRRPRRTAAKKAPAKKAAAKTAPAKKTARRRRQRPKTTAEETALREDGRRRTAKKAAARRRPRRSKKVAETAKKARPRRRPAKKAASKKATPRRSRDRDRPADDGGAGTVALGWDPVLGPAELQRAVTARGRARAGRRCCAGSRPPYRPLIGGLGAPCCGRASDRRGYAGLSSRSRTVASTTWSLYARLAGDLVGGPDGFSGVMNTVLPRKRLIAHVLMRDQRGRILLCDTMFKSDWELPGGIVEPGEPPRAGASVRSARSSASTSPSAGCWWRTGCRRTWAGRTRSS